MIMVCLFRHLITNKLFFGGTQPFLYKTTTHDMYALVSNQMVGRIYFFSPLEFV